MAPGHRWRAGIGKSVPWASGGGTGEDAGAEADGSRYVIADPAPKAK